LVVATVDSIGISVLHVVGNQLITWTLFTSKGVVGGRSGGRSSAVLTQ